MTIDEILRGVVGPYGAAFMLVFNLVALLTGLMIPKWIHQKSERRCALYEQILFETLGLSKRATSAVERLAEVNRQEASDV